MNKDKLKAPGFSVSVTTSDHDFQGVTGAASLPPIRSVQSALPLNTHLESHREGLLRKIVLVYLRSHNTNHCISIQGTLSMEILK